MTTLLIPKVLHWIWFGDKPLPAQHARWMETWRRFHPGWDYQLWTDRNRPTFTNESQWLEADNFAAKADIARYEIICRFGGIYVDTDIECVRSIEPLLDRVEAFAVKGGVTMIESCPIGATQGHPWMSEVVAKLPESVRTHWGNMEKAGPRFLTRVTAGRSDVTVFPETWFTRLPNDDAKLAEPWALRKRAEAYAIHFYAKSWTVKSHGDYLSKLREIVVQEVEPIVPPGSFLILVCKGGTLNVSGGLRVVPFPERDGEWAGHFSSEGDAIAELRRLRGAGARFIVFPSWMLSVLDAYPGLARVLTAESRCVVKNPRVLIFDLLV
jgi:hypothetical protein